MAASLEARVLDATKSCCERFGFAKLSIEDVAAEAGVSRATIYRLYPGGKDVLLEGLRVRELEEFFGRLRAGVAGADSLDELLVRIIHYATTFLVPFAEPFLSREQSVAVVDVLSRLTISYFLAPSDLVDLGDPDSARRFLAPLITVLTQGDPV